MSRKKPSGLSKKVPAIFQGLPDLGEQAKEPASARPSAGEGSFTPAAALKGRRKVRFLFEIEEKGIRSLTEWQKGNDWEILKTSDFFFGLDYDEKRMWEDDRLAKWIDDLKSEFETSELWDVRLILNGQGTYLTQIPRPAVTKASEFRNTVLWDIAEKIPFPAEESLIQFADAGKNVLVGAVQHAVLDPIVDFFHDSEIYPSVITMLGITYQTLNNRFYLYTPGNTLVMHIGRTQTTIMVFLGGRIQFSREIPLGEDHITESMMGTLALQDSQVVIDYEQAQTIKETIGLPTPDLMPNPEEPKLSQLAARIRPIFEKWVSEIRISILQFQRETGGEAVQQIVLSGQGSNLKTIDNYFSVQTGLPTRKLEIDKTAVESMRAMASLIGLRYAPAGFLNFAPSEDRWRPEFRTWAGRIRKGSVVLAALIGVLFLITQFQVAAAHIELGILQKKFNKLGPTAQKMQELDENIRIIGERREEIRTQLGVTPYWGGMLREVSNLVPSGMVLSEIKMDETVPGVLLFRGTILSGEARYSADQTLARFLEKLNSSPFFENANLDLRQTVSDKQAEGIEFVVRANIVSAREY